MGGLKSGKIVNDEENRAKIEAAAKVVRRIEQGDSGDVTGSEALVRYGVVASKLSPEELDEATEKALDKLPEDQRVEFGKLLQDAGQIDSSVDVTDVRALAKATSTSSAGGAGISGLLGGLLGGGSQGAGGLDLGGLLGGGSSGGSGQASAGGLELGGLLGGLLGGGGTSSSQGSGGLDLGGMLGGLLGGGSSSQAAATAGGGGGMDLGDLINNPLVKSVIAGIAGNGMEKVVGNAGGMDNFLGGLLGGGDSESTTKDDDGQLPNARKGVVA